MPDQKTIYMMIIDTEEKMNCLYDEIVNHIDTSNLKILKYNSVDYKGYTYIKIFNQYATRDHMLKELMKIYHIKKTITFGSIEGKYDVIVNSENANIVAKTLDSLYQPFFFKNKKAILA